MRYVTICFRGDHADRWHKFATLELAEAAVVGVGLCNVDSRCAMVYDLDLPGLLADREEFDDAEWLTMLAKSADEAMADLVNNRTTPT